MQRRLRHHQACRAHVKIVVAEQLSRVRAERHTPDQAAPTSAASPAAAAAAVAAAVLAAEASGIACGTAALGGRAVAAGEREVVDFEHAQRARV
eukprot:138072-Chlamydomonas_euryale.AAC.1